MQVGCFQNAGDRITDGNDTTEWDQSGGADTRSDIVIERFDDRVPDDFEPAAQIIPDRDAKFVAGLGEAEGNASR